MKRDRHKIHCAAYNASVNCVTAIWLSMQHESMLQQNRNEFSECAT